MTDKVEQTTLTEPEPKASCDQRRFIHIVSILLLLLALGIASLAFYKSKQALSLQTAEKNYIHSIEKSKESLRQSFTEQINLLSKELHTSLDLFSSKKPDWSFFKAKYYMELAQINSKWNSNNQITIALLEQADDLLKASNQQQIVEVRQALAKEILELKAQPVLDITGLLTKLSALQAAIPSLEIKTAASTENKPAPKASSKPTTWREKFQDSLTALSQLVIIRKDSDNSLALYSPRYEALLRENLRMDLKQAQWALLQKSQAAYLNALNQAAEDLTRGFKKSAQSSAFSKLLDELKTISFEQNTSINLQSLTILTEFLKAPEAAKGENK